MEFENVQNVYALSPLQEGMLFHSISEPRSGVFVEQICCSIHGRLDVDGFKIAWDRVVERHDTLRTIFLWDGLDEPLQVVKKQVSIPWTLLDWSDHGPAQATALHQLLASDRRQGLDLSAAPLMRMTLICLGPQLHRFIWTFHHLLADGWSTPLVLDEVLGTYRNLRTGATSTRNEPFAYSDYIAYLQAKPLAEAESFWRGRLRGFATPNRLTDHL